MRNVTGVAATNVITTQDDHEPSRRDVNHGLRVGDRVVFAGLAGGTGLTDGTVYYVASVPGDRTFTVEETLGGGAVDFTTDITDGTVRRRTTRASRAARVGLI